MVDQILADVEGNQEAVGKNEEIIRGINDYLISINPPSDFSHKNSAVDAMDISFGKLCAHLEDAGVANAKNLSIYEFHIRMDFFDEKARRAKKGK